MYFDFVAGDHEQAYFWFKKAAQNGDAKAQFNLEVRALGKKDFESCEEARYWLDLARNNGMSKAKTLLGRVADCTHLPKRP
jgi:hypothetical protein